ncbi:MAG: sigma-54-dependent Fis family transcriptional regulator [Deltaproteobacteria bacterium]|nr:sigma-54-dependent Fis family transcriptional regulator [Deltaproteobacteria bacterium]
MLAWSLDEPARLGEAFPVERTTAFGRGTPLSDDPAPRGSFVRSRPGQTTPCAPIANARISRIHLVLEPDGDDIRIRSVGRASMRINGNVVTEGVAREGDVVELHNAAVFYVCRRPLQLAPMMGEVTPFAFGDADPFGLVGESEAAWALRAAYAFAASTDRHVLLLGESGVGKELGARSIHGLSARNALPFIARNASTMPETLLDAELFGNAKNYPNAGMPERPGLIGEADGSTLFLDEIGDLPEKSQVHLLRVLDSDGEYQRLGESRTRRSSLKLVAATNRAPDTLKHDFLARFVHRIEIPGLPHRREDIPLVAAHILRRIATGNASIAARFFERRNGEIAEARLQPELVARLLRHPFTHHVRELERILWVAIGTASGDFIGVTPEVDAELRDSADSAAEVTEVDRETLAKALADNDRSPTKTAKALGLKNRYVLIRLLKKHGLSAKTEETRDDR